MAGGCFACCTAWVVYLGGSGDELGGFGEDEEVGVYFGGYEFHSFDDEGGFEEGVDGDGAFALVGVGPGGWHVGVGFCGGGEGGGRGVGIGSLWGKGGGACLWSWSRLGCGGCEEEGEEC